MGEAAKGGTAARRQETGRFAPRLALTLALGLGPMAAHAQAPAATGPAPASPTEAQVPASTPAQAPDASASPAPPAAVAGTPPAAAPAAAGEASPEIVLQLNNLQPIPPAGCRFTFLATNNRPTPIERLGVELVVFDAERKVDQFLVLEFTRLAGNKTKVSQFDLAERPCDAVSQLLVNDVVNCGIEEGETPTCAERVKLENLTGIGLAY